MLVFKKIRYKNFLSTGNQFNEIELNKHSSTLITGKNGEGKSTILCALTFALFGKPFRNINKGQLVNSINGKNCLVEIEFEINGRQYEVKRGIKPNVFEIWCSGEMINQDAALKDYQKVLEQQILKLNYKTFTQVVILGSATFVPFMQLPSTQRREVIEDILDIKVFSIMNGILKEKMAGVKDELVQVESEISNHKVKIQSQKKLIEVLESNRQMVVSGIRSKIESNNQQINEAQDQIQQISDSIEKIKPKADSEQVSEAIATAGRVKVKLKTNVDTCEHTKEFFHNNTTCPTCSQEIAEGHKQKVLKELDDKIAEHQAKLDQVTTSLDKLNDKLATINQYANRLKDLSIEMSTYSNKIAILTEQNKELLTELNTANNDTGNLTEEKSKMKQFASDAIELVQRKSELLDEKQLHDVASALLKDTGIKTAIIREYLPVINKLINRHLDKMNLYISFQLDESFQEVIKSRHRDQFTYSSFSEGEKRRIDLAVLYTWRQIAKMKNSVNTNLLFMDEILDSSLDTNGMDYFMSMMEDMKDTNLFVISHRTDQVSDKFDAVITVTKKNDFSVVSTV
jgi:DNA repair exonuclease SbcCD ATPase subunit